MNAVPISLAFAAGGLATLNPCGFSLLPALLSFYVGAKDTSADGASTRVAEGLLVGVAVAAGFLGVFSVVGLPITYGVTVAARALPWVGIALGLALTTTGLVALAGRRISLPFVRVPGTGPGRRPRAMVLFGVAYGAASLSCTLPVFLTLIGASLSATGTAGALVVFLAYGLGIAVVLVALSVMAALVHEGLARVLHRLLPYLPRLTGGLLALAGLYLTYYWLRVRFGPRATLATDPLVGRVTIFTARLQGLAAGNGLLLVLVAAAVVVGGVGLTWWEVHARARRGRAQLHPEESPS